jgi:colicin import membrane protein
VAAAAHDLLLPRPPGGMVPGAALALLAHAAMLVALTTVVQWRASAPEAVSAELWSAVPQVAAPPAPEPAPPPPVAPPRPAPAPPPPVPKAEPPAPDPQIAIAQAKAEREKLERERSAREKAERERELKERQRAEREAEAERRAKAEARAREAKAREAKAEEERLAQQRQKNLERLMGQVGTGPARSAGTAAQSAGPSAGYTARLVAAIKPNIVFTEAVSGNPAAEVEVRVGPSGSILSARIVRPSGLKDWDDAVLRAIDRTGTLPRDVDGRVPPVLTIVFRPKE